MKKTDTNFLISRKNLQRKTFALSVLSASLILANTAVYADGNSPFPKAPLHLLNPGQTEIVTNTVTHTVDNVAKPNIMLYLDNSNSMNIYHASQKIDFDHN